MNTARQQDGRQFFYIYTAMFVVLSLVVFSPFIVNGCTFIWKSDGLTQHIKALSYYGMYLRDLLGSLFSGQGFQMPTYSFGIGYGEDILGTLNYYAIGDPLSVLAVFVPEEHTPALYTALVIVRLYLAGLAFGLYVRYTFKTPATGTVAGAITFIFCGYSLFASVRHPYFINPLIYMPLILYGVEKVLRERKHVAFSLAIALSAISNFYFFYMLFLVMALYIVVRLIAIHHHEGARVGIRHALASFGHLVGSGLIGVFISCILFLPVVMFFLQDSRQTVSYPVPLLYSLKYYRTLIINLSTTSDPGEWTFVSTGIFSIIAITSLFSERKSNRQLKLAVILLFIMLCIPWVGHVFNGFSYVSNRWCWAFSLAVSCAIALRWKALMSLTRKQAITMIACVEAYVVISAVINFDMLSIATMLIVVALWTLSVLAVAFISTRNNALQTAKSNRFTQGFIMLVICAGISLNAFAIYSPLGGNYANSFVRWFETDDIFNNEAHAIAQLDDEDDGFYRYSAARPLMTRNSAALEGISSTAEYWSLVNTYTKRFLSDMGITGSDSGSCCWYNLDGQSALYELLGVNRFVAQPETVRPYGFTTTPVATGSFYSPRSRTEKEYEIYENDAALPFGFTYSRALSAQAFFSLEPRQRREVPLQNCVVGDSSRGGLSSLINPISDDASSECSFESTIVPYEIKLGENVTQEGNSFIATGKKTKVTLNVDAPKKAEISLQFTEINLDTNTESIEIDALFTYKDGTKATCTISVGSLGSNTYEPYHWITVGPGYSESELKSIRLTLPKEGTYSYEDLQVIAQPMTSFDTQVKALTQDTLQNVDLHYLSEKTAATCRVTGSITLDEPKILCTQIPFSDGWRVFVDGQEADLLQLNTMMSGVQLDAGEHNVEFTYETPGLKLGALISLLGFALLICMVIIERKYTRKKKDLQENEFDLS